MSIRCNDLAYGGVSAGIGLGLLFGMDARRVEGRVGVVGMNRRGIDASGLNEDSSGRACCVPGEIDVGSADALSMTSEFRISRLLSSP